MINYLVSMTYMTSCIAPCMSAGNNILRLPIIELSRRF
jgi:hypothetical protein